MLIFVARALLSNKIFARNALAVSFSAVVELVFNALILLLKLTVSLAIRFVNMAEVSEMFSFVLMFVAKALLSNKIFALNALAVSFNAFVELVFNAVMRLLRLTVSLPIRFVNIADVSEILTFKLMFVANALLSNKIFARNAVAVSFSAVVELVFNAVMRLLRLTVSLAIRLVNIADVSEMFNFVANELAVAAVLA